MTLIGPFNLDIQPGSTSSSLSGSVLAVSASLVEAAESITLFASNSIEGAQGRLQGTLDLGVAVPHFRNLTVPNPGDTIEVSGSELIVRVDGALVIDPVPAVVGFRVLIDTPAIATNSFSLIGRTAPFTTGTIVVENTASVVVENTASVIVEAAPLTSGTVVIENTASVVIENTASVIVEAAPVTEVTGGVVSVLQAADVSLNTPVFISGSVVVSDITQAEPVLVTGSFEAVGVTQVTGSVEVVAEPLAETRSVIIDGQPIDVSGSVVISDLSQTEPVLITGSVSTAASTIATQSVSIVDQRVTQSVDLVLDDVVRVLNTQSVVIDARAPAIIGPSTSPDGHTVGSFVSMSRREKP